MVSPNDFELFATVRFSPADFMQFSRKDAGCSLQLLNSPEIYFTSGKRWRDMSKGDIKRYAEGIRSLRQKITGTFAFAEILRELSDRTRRSTPL